MKGEFIYYSKPYDYGLHDPDEDYIPLGKRFDHDPGRDWSVRGR